MEVINILFFIFVLCVFMIVNNNEIKVVEKFNLIYIVIQVIFYCGLFFVCDKFYLVYFNILYDVEMKFSVCGLCYCNEVCKMIINECCFDVYFKYGYM